jgi:hypothetical protein
MTILSDLIEERLRLIRLGFDLVAAARRGVADGILGYGVVIAAAKR